MTLDQAKNEIHSKLQNDRMREMMDKVNNSFNVETNEAYFGPGGGSPMPPRGSASDAGNAAWSAHAAPKRPPPAQPPAAKPN